ncbi:MAG TPA: VOC family protein [Verrucomicrobiae bacterium]|nr:VOC family protein [Verrucomicrobiae bacterium]
MNANKNYSIQTYLVFNGRCEEAVEFYRQKLGAEIVMLLRFKDAPDPNMIAPGAENKIMHATLKIGDTIVFASDGRCENGVNFSGFSLSLSVKTEAEADKFFAALTDGGQVTMPLTKTFFSPRFDMVADRFGVSWMVIIPQN